MCATTLKVDDRLLEEIALIKPADMSVSAFVRDLVHREVTKNKLKESAQKYKKFLDNHSGESKWLDDWQESDLSTPPKKIKDRK